MTAGGKKIVMTDSKGIIGFHRNDLNSAKQEVLSLFTLDEKGDIHSAMNNADVFIGVSKAEIIDKTDIEKMNKDAIVFAMANPTPEIFPDEAKAGGARIVATGRSDFANQVNNVVAFPGLFAGLFAIQARSITPEIFMVVADAIANSIDNPSEENIIPSPLDKSVAENVKQAVIQFSK
jgi:malate dehydrogenase (oxaloacetate-decarboxylating)